MKMIRCMVTAFHCFLNVHCLSSTARSVSCSRTDAIDQSGFFTKLTAKTEFLIVRSKHQLERVNIAHFMLVRIRSMMPVRNLSVIFHFNLKMVMQITKAYSNACYNLYNIRRIRKFPSEPRNHMHHYMHMAYLAGCFGTEERNTQ